MYIYNPSSFSEFQLFPRSHLTHRHIHLLINPTKKWSISRERNLTSRGKKHFKKMTKSVSAANSGEENKALRNFKLNESTFLASLMPKKEIAADRFIEAHPNFDGRGTVIAIFGDCFFFFCVFLCVFLLQILCLFGSFIDEMPFV